MVKFDILLNTSYYLEMILNQLQLQHLYWRTGFGISLKEVQEKKNSNLPYEINEIFNASSQPYELDFINKNDDTSGPYPKNLSPDEGESFGSRQRQAIFYLNYSWVEQIRKSESDLRNKIVIFWHDHFSCECFNPMMAQLQINTLNKHALGSFKDLLISISKDAGMLYYLNNQQNLKGAPNENYARELMELFTIGTGNYEENDIYEVARAFTGWQTRHVDGEWEFYFNEKHHDFGEKTIFGVSGNFDGTDVIDLLLENKKTADKLARKLFLFFVADIPDEALINEMSTVLYDSDYNIEVLLGHVFSSEWFFETRFVGQKLKNPMEYLIGTMRQLGANFSPTLFYIHAQEQLGQVLLKPPNVGGWPQGREWINNTTLMFRMKLPETMLAEAHVDGWYNFVGSRDYKSIYHKIQGFANLSYLYGTLASENNEDMFNELKYYLLQNHSSFNQHPSLWPLRRHHFIENLRIFMQAPEYQLC